MNKHGFKDDKAKVDPKDPVPYKDHHEGITYELPLGELVKQSSLRNGVIIYDGLPEHYFPTYLSLLPFGMVVEKTLM